jgi:hypothetical protein
MIAVGERRVKGVTLAAALGLVAFAVIALWAQATAQTNRSTSPPGEVVRAQHPEASALLDAFERGQALLYERLLAAAHASAEPTDEELYDELRSGLRQAGPARTTNQTPQVLARAVAVFDRADQFRRRIYEILADSTIADHVTAVEDATDDYLRQRALALSAAPKSLELIVNRHGHDPSAGVDQAYPKVRGLIRAYQWLELALCEPLIAYDAPDSRRVGVSAAVSRFREMLEHPPHTSPSEMPTAPAIAPSLAQRHPRAAAIFDNAHALHRVIADILADEHAETGLAIEDAIDTFVNPQQLIVSRDEWVLTSLRRGIWWQGGPAIGRMDEPERNRRLQHAAHGRMPLPGMGDLPADLGDSQREGQTPGEVHRQH